MSEEKTIETDVKQEQADTKVENNVPISRLNEVISERNDLRDALKALQADEDKRKFQKLEDEEKWQELNSELQKQLDTYKPYKERWESMDARIRESALSKLPESTREKFSTVDTDVLLNIVDEFSVQEKSNPPDRKGTIPTEKIGDWTEMSGEDRRANWQSIVESYMKR